MRRNSNRIVKHVSSKHNIQTIFFFYKQECVRRLRLHSQVKYTASTTYWNVQAPDLSPELTVELNGDLRGHRHQHLLL